MYCAVFVLKWSFHRNELSVRYRATVTFKEFLGDDDVEDIRFIRNGHKDEALCRTGPLLYDGLACCLNKFAIASLPQFNGGEVSLLLELLPAEVHGMRAGSHACPCIVGNQPFLWRHLSQW